MQNEVFALRSTELDQYQICLYGFTRNIFKKDIRRREDDDFMIEKLYNGSKTFIFHQTHVQLKSKISPLIMFFRRNFLLGGR